MSKYDDDTRAAREAHYVAQKALLDLAAHAIREAFIAGTEGLQLAMALTTAESRFALREALSMISHDTRVDWLANALTAVDAALRDYATVQYDDATRRRWLAGEMSTVLYRIASGMPKRCTRDENVVILRAVTNRVFFRAVPKRNGTTFVEYDVVGLDGRVKVSTRGENAYVVIV